MEKFSSIASGVSKAVWGDDKAQQSTEEPPAGQTGEGTAVEPYDAGNSPEQASVSQSTETPEKAKESGLEPTTTSPTATKPSNARMPSFATKDKEKEKETGEVTEATTESAPAPEKPADQTEPQPQEGPAPGTVVAERKDDSEVADGVDMKQAKSLDSKSPFDTQGSGSEARQSRSREEDNMSPDRGISPGTLPSGERVQTGKVEKTKFSDKLKSKFKMGKH